MVGDSEFAFSWICGQPQFEGQSGLKFNASLVRMWPKDPTSVIAPIFGTIPAYSDSKLGKYIH